MEDELRKHFKGQFASVIPSDYDCISNNPFHSFKVASQESTFHQTCLLLSQRTSAWVRTASEQAIAQGKKVNPFMNYQVSEKVKLIFRLMQRLIHALGPSPGSEQTSQANGISLFDFLSVCKGINSQGGKSKQEHSTSVLSVREKIA